MPGGVKSTLHLEPPVGFEPTTARLRIESSTTELRWRRSHNLATQGRARYSFANRSSLNGNPSRTPRSVSSLSARRTSPGVPYNPRVVADRVIERVEPQCVDAEP